MQEAKKQTIKLSKYFVSLPSPAKTMIAIAIISVILGIFSGMAKQRSITPSGIMLGAIDGIFLFCLPAIVSSLLLYLLRRKAVFRRAVFLGLITSVCYGLFYLASVALDGIIPFAANLVFVGFGLAFVTWYFLLLLAFDFRKSAVLFATMQLIIFAAFFMTQLGIGSEGIADALVKMYTASIVFLIALYGMFYFVSAPMKKNLGISSMDALSMFASQWLYGEKDLEEVFDEIGETVETFVFVARFSGKKNDAFFVVPYIHYGPFGNLGGSEFTHKIASALSENEKREVLVFHGTATHDFNPVSSSEIDNVVGACRKAIAAMKPKNELISLVEARDGSVRARLMKIGKCAMLSFSRAPLTTEDVSFGIGLTLLEKASKSSECACVIDEHNAETGDITSVELGSPIGFEMLSAADKALGRNARMEDFRFGCASSKVAAETMGSAGLKLALFERGKRLDAILLADSNSITPQFREQVLASIKSEAKKAGYECNAEVMTTDTHQINTVKGVINPLGEESGEAVLGAITKMMPEAIGKLEAVKFGASQQKFSIRVFGTGQSAEIASTINAVVSVLRLALPIILVGSIVLLLWGLARI